MKKTKFIFTIAAAFLMVSAPWFFTSCDNSDDSTNESAKSDTVVERIQLQMPTFSISRLSGFFARFAPFLLTLTLVPVKLAASSCFLKAGRA